MPSFEPGGQRKRLHLPHEYLEGQKDRGKEEKKKRKGLSSNPAGNAPPGGTVGETMPLDAQGGRERVRSFRSLTRQRGEGPGGGGGGEGVGGGPGFIVGKKFVEESEFGRIATKTMYREEEEKKKKGCAITVMWKDC